MVFGSEDHGQKLTFFLGLVDESFCEDKGEDIGGVSVPKEECLSPNKEGTVTTRAFWDSFRNWASWSIDILEAGSKIMTRKRYSWHEDPCEAKKQCIDQSS